MTLLRLSGVRNLYFKVPRHLEIITSYHISRELGVVVSGGFPNSFWLRGMVGMLCQKRLHNRGQLASGYPDLQKNAWETGPGKCAK